MQHFTPLENAAYKFFKTFRATPAWAKCVGRDGGGGGGGVEYFREDRTVRVKESVYANTEFC